MSSTELTVDTQDIEFIVNEWLHLEKLSESERFKDFDGETLNLLIKEGQTFSKEVLAPTRETADKEGCVLVDGVTKVPECLHEAYQKAYELGWGSLTANPNYGGQGAPLTLGLAIREAQIPANMGLAMYFGLTEGCANLIHSFGTQALKDKYLERMYTGEFLGTMCLSESNAGSDVGAALTSADPVGDGRYKIKGSKCWISSGDSDLGENTIHAVLARIKGAPAGTKGLSLFLVPTKLVDDEGVVGENNDVVTAAIEHKMGIKCSTTAVLNFGDNDHCYGHLLGEEGKGMNAMFQMMNEARMGTAALGLCMCAGAYQNTLSYARERIQGVHINNIRDPDAEKVAIIEHPDVRLMLVNMKARVEAMRALLYATTLMLDEMESLDNEEERQEIDLLVQVLTPMCKGWATEVGIDVTRTCMQVLGGVGYTQDFPIEQAYRDVRITAIYEGTTGIQALDLVGRKMTMHNGALFMKLMTRFGKMMEEHSEHKTMGPIVQEWSKHCETLGEVAMGVQDVMQTRGMEGVALYATPFLMFCSSVTAAYFYIQQGLVASEKLEALKQENKIGETGYQAFLDENSKARFYDNKIKTIHYYVEAVIPTFEGLLAIARKRNFDPLDIRL
ncbi:acyl-CoA dehydrogenase [Deltaproteobacteria bacterium TL4]